MPPNPVELPPKTKRAMTICNLFMNHYLSLLTYSGYWMKTAERSYGNSLNMGSSTIGGKWRGARPVGSNGDLQSES